jgi:Uma2 family endonuclease
LQEFSDLPDYCEALRARLRYRTELVNGEIISKMSPTSSHSRAQKHLLILLDDWWERTNLGEVNPEWTIALKHNGVNWATVPDLTYISHERVPPDWEGQGICVGQLCCKKW